MSSKPVIAILGGGNAAFAAAADLTLRGFEVRMLEAPEFEATIKPVLEAGGIQLENPGVAGFAESGFARIPLVTTDPASALEGADVVLYVIPAFGERRFTELIAPCVTPDQLVVLFCGTFGGALEFAHGLRSRGVARMPLIAETEAVVYGGFKSGPAGVRLAGRKAGVGVAALPAPRGEEAVERLKPMYPDFAVAANVLATSLANPNPMCHIPAMILNAGRIDKAAPSFRFYWDGITEPVGRVIATMDEERLRLAEVLGLRLPTTRELLLNWYANQGAAGDTVSKVMSTNPAYKSTIAPQSLNHRFLTEELPFSVVPMEALGQAFGVPTPVMTALVTLSCELAGVDFRVQGRTLQSLGLQGLSVAEIRQMLAGA